MVFNKFENQSVYQVNCAGGEAGITLNVGDLFSHDPSTNAIVKIETKANAKSAVASGLELYLVAQGDAVTEKTGTAYNHTISVEQLLSKKTQQKSLLLTELT